ncbi:MAG: replication ATP-dependent helicase/nuclease Dna2 [Bacteroidota bacterium]|nr:replication ATP-dependent helicase/nuclease Dna2 [Bacteroidota bacterium]
MFDASPYLTEIEEISNSDLTAGEKIIRLNRLLDRLSKSIVRDETLQFANQFSRLVFIAQKYNLSKQHEWQLQHFRVKAREIRRNKGKKTPAAEYRRMERAFLDLCHIVGGQPVTQTEPIREEIAKTPAAETMRVQITAIDREKKELHCISEHAPIELTIKYGINAEQNTYQASIDRFWVGAQLNLIDCTTDNEGCLIPRHFVLEPDYLIDASALAECFQDYCKSPLHYFRNKFEEKENRSYLLLGNLANFFLDKLVFAEHPEEVSFMDVFLQSFKQSPFEYASCNDIRSDEDFRDFMATARQQFENIRRVVTKDFPSRKIDRKRCILEPSFFSEKFGFQGRLDMLQADAKQQKFNIVELKSGRLPFPPSEKGKIALNHETQTAIYRMMIESVFGADSRAIDAAILYSAGNIPGENLRFAAVYKQLEKEIVNMRNLIVADEYQLTYGDNRSVENKFEELFQSVEGVGRLPAFYLNKIEALSSVLQQATDVERSYFYRFVRFIAREMYLQKIGDTEYESPTGVAALWNSDFAERAESLDVLYDLTIDEKTMNENDMSIRFCRNHPENDIVNFREGDICIVYPRNSESDNVLNQQILKGTIEHITPDEVHIRFRYKQHNPAYFDENRYWAVEHDTLDNSYNGMYRNLFSFLSASHRKRDLLLGLQEPRTRQIEQTEEKPYPENIISKALAAEDYFLIVGPPGTGKTSIFARRLIEEYYAQPDTNILVLAYTNRAVDELCEAINAAFDRKSPDNAPFIRIGSELSCAEPYRDRLLQRISEKALNREQLRNEIEQTRIFVATIASLNGRMELFSLKDFQIAIVDEASQILEPQLVGILPKVNKFILIGDHNQLSTIVLQKPIVSAIHEPELNRIGFVDCRDSLFERLFRVCNTNGREDVCVQLTQQGRMHNDIANFPSTFYYSQGLCPASEWQQETWTLECANYDNLFDRCVASQRVAVFSTEKLFRFTPSDKINETEAEIVVRLVQSINRIYEANGKSFSSEMLGIIAPYRNQIALIKHKLASAGISDYEKIMVDTVERFQGSQREVILLSFCVNRPYQLDLMCNLNHEGKVDRKLNVAITRARQQFFMTGNAHLLRLHPVYATLLDYYDSQTFVLNEIP